MVSFPILFLTLVTGYGQVVNPRFVLPFSHWVPLEWATDGNSPDQRGTSRTERGQTGQWLRTTSNPHDS